MRKWIFLGAVLSISFVQCKPKAVNPKVIDLQATCVKALSEVMVHDIMAPPVTSRVYVYCNLVFYETMRLGNPEYKSLLGKLKGFEPAKLPIDFTGANLELAAVQAFATVANELVFSKDSMAVKINKIKQPFIDHIGKAIITKSRRLGDSIAAIILARAATDNYKNTRGMPRFSAFAQNNSWQQTPPDYMDAVEPHWQKIMPLLLDSFNQFAPPPPPAFSKDKNSPFFLELQEVYDVSKNITSTQDSIARYWDDNPMVTNHTGHFTFATKKTTPVGHWMGIVGILAKTKKLDDVATAQLFALSSAAIFDGFISCWAEKYKSKKLRPITTIRELIDPTWNALLQTPAFPEYTSGHSVISSAAATVLEKQLGIMPFVDSSVLYYIGSKRSFLSIKAAAKEAGISRLYGGIHYRSGIEAGAQQGEQIGALYNTIFNRLTTQ